MTFKGAGIIVLFLLLFLTSFVYPDSHLNLKKVKFEHYTIEDGISQNSIFCIIQDKKGFLWLGSEGGLNRFDGYTFEVYEHQFDRPGSLSNNYVETIYEDKDGIIWVGTQDGLNRFDRLHDRFTTFKPETGVPGSISHRFIRCITEDRVGLLWVGTKNGLNKYNRLTGKFSQFQPPLYHCKSNCHLEGVEVASFLQDMSGNYWVGTCCGLWKMDPKKNSFRRTSLDKFFPGEYGNFEVRAIFEDHRGFLWLGTKEKGLIRCDWKNNKFRVFGKNLIADTSGSSSDGIRAIIQDPDNKDILWIGTIVGGLYRFNTVNETSHVYKERDGVPYSLKNNSVYSLCTDHSGILWVGTQNGLSKLDKRKSCFNHWTVEPDIDSTLGDEYVWAIFKDRNGFVWVGTTKGLDKLDRETEKILHYTEKNSGLSEDAVFAIRQDPQGMIWIGTWGGGLNRLNPDTDTFEVFRNDKKELGSLSDNYITSLLVGRQGHLWVGTENEGLNLFNAATKTFTRYIGDPVKEGNTLPKNVNCIVESPAGEIWIGSDQGLHRMNPETGEFVFFEHDSNQSNSLSQGNVSDIFIDSNGTLWIGIYGGGVNKMVDGEKGIFEHFRKKRNRSPASYIESRDWLPSDVINGILEGNDGYLWISTDKGITRFNPVTETFKNFDSRDGLQSNEFNGRSLFKSPDDGELFFGGINGFNAFYPTKLIVSPHKPAVVLTGFEVFNKSYLETPVSEKNNIRLSYKDSVFSIEFSLLDFSVPSKNKYLYQIKKVDHGWVPRDYTKRFATYTNLSPGKYVFRVKAINNDGIESKEAQLNIIITPPFWQTWWFRIAMALAFMFLLFKGFRARTRRLREKLAEQQRVQELLKKSHDEMEEARDLAVIRSAETQLLLTAISSIFVAVDSDGIIFQWNKPAVHFFGIPREQALKKSLIEVLAGNIDSKTLENIIERGFSHDESTRRMEISVDLSSQGRGLRLLVATVSSIRDKVGKKLGFLLMAEDITNRKEKEMQQNLSKKLEALGQMASGIAHEIKTPLQYIGHNARFVSDSFTEVMDVFRLLEDAITASKEEPSSNGRLATHLKKKVEEYDIDYIMEEVPKASEQIISGVSKVSEIIHSMTEYSYPGRGFKEKFNINDLIQSTLVMVRSRIKRRADVELQLDEQLPMIPCFPGELTQVLLNILINAVDAVDEADRWGVITMITSKEDKEVVIKISDNGVGIPECDRDHIFNPFFTTKEVGKGTGQGLSLAHNVIIEKHNGKLEFESKVGEGTTFIIRLPIDSEGEY